jgi:hypothetical protein
MLPLLTPNLVLGRARWLACPPARRGDLNRIIDRVVRSINRLLSERVTRLWRMKDSVQSTIKNACVLYRELKQYVATVKLMLSEYKTYCSSALQSLLVFTTGQFAEHVCKRIERVICTLVGMEVYSRVDADINEFPEVFLRSKGLIGKLFSCSFSSDNQHFGTIYSSNVYYSLNDI